MSALTARLGTVVLSAALVVVGLEVTSYAATGHPLVLGQSNSESRTASLTNTGKGPALTLRAGKKFPALAVGNAKKVAHLNADSVDGFDGAALRTNAVTYTIPGGATHAYTLTGVQPGRYLASLDISLVSATDSTCGLYESPSGSYVTSATAPTTDGVANVSAISVITHPAGSDLVLQCFSPIFDNASLFTSTVSLIPLGSVQAGVLGTAPAGKRPPPGR